MFSQCKVAGDQHIEILVHTDGRYQFMKNRQKHVLCLSITTYICCWLSICASSVCARVRDACVCVCVVGKCLYWSDRVSYLPSGCIHIHTQIQTRNRSLSCCCQNAMPYSNCNVNNIYNFDEFHINIISQIDVCAQMWWWAKWPIRSCVQETVMKYPLSLLVSHGCLWYRQSILFIIHLTRRARIMLLICRKNTFWDWTEDSLIQLIHLRRMLFAVIS